MAYYRALLALNVVTPELIAQTSQRIAAENRHIPHDIIFLLKSCLKVPGTTPEHIDVLLLRVADNANVFTSAHLRSIAFYAARLQADGRYRHQRLFHRAVISTIKEGHHGNTLIDVVMSAALVKGLTASMASAIAPLCLKHLPSCPLRHRLRLQWAFASCSQTDPSLFAAIAAIEQAALPQHSAHALHTITWAFARLGLLDNKLFDAIATATARLEHELSRRELVVIVWALAGYCLHRNIHDLARNLVARLWHACAEASINADSIGFLDCARLCLIHCGCVLEPGLAERVALEADRSREPPSTKKAFIRDTLLELMRELGVEGVEIELRCDRSGMLIPLAITPGRIAIETVLRSEVNSSTYQNLAGSALIRHDILRHCGWNVITITELEILACKEPYDRFRLLIDKLNL